MKCVIYKTKVYNLTNRKGRKRDKIDKFIINGRAAAGIRKETKVVKEKGREVRRGNLTNRKRQRQKEKEREEERERKRGRKP